MLKLHHLPSLLLVFALIATLTAACTPSAPPTPVPGVAPLPTASPGAVTVKTARPVYEVVGEKDAPFAAISPNGEQIAWFAETGRGKERNGQICMFTFSSSAKKCYPMPMGKFMGYPYQLQWSPDSKTIAYTENPIEFGYDGDIWVFKPADGSFANLTDEGVTGSWRVEEGKPIANVDYVPMWNSADGQIYFWRVVPKGNFQFTLGLYRIPSTGGQPALVRDLTTAITSSIPFYDYERFFMDGVSSISPDGSQVAALMGTVDQMGYGQASLWHIDLKNTSAAPKKLMVTEDFQKALPDWNSFPAKPLGLAWTADSKAVVVDAYSYGSSQLPFMVFYHVTPATGAIQPTIDFSTLPSYEAYYAPVAQGGLPWRAYSPWSGSLSPKGNKLLMVNDLGGSMGLFTTVLPPDGKLPAVSASAQQSLSMASATRSSRSTGDKLIVYGLLLTIDEK